MEKTNIKFWLSFDQLEKLVLRGLASDEEKKAFHEMESKQSFNSYIYA